MSIDYQAALTAFQTLYPDAAARLSAPGGADAFNAWWGKLEQDGLSDQTLGALVNMMNARPDQKQAFIQQGGDVKAYLDGMVNFWNGEGGHAASNRLGDFAPELAVIDSLGYKVNPVAVNNGTASTIDPNGNTSVEQYLGGRVWSDYVMPDLAGDAQRKIDAQNIVNQVNRSIDTAITNNNQLLDGSRLKDEYTQADDTAARMKQAAAEAAATRVAALDQRKAEMTAALDKMSQDRSGALDAQTAQLRAGLAQLETERKAALEQLSAARIAAAEGQVTGINQALQTERDRITAETAQQGFIGGSTMEDAALARATIGARQGAAEAMGGAKVSNATDSRNLTDEIANARFGITGNDASTRFGISEDANKGRFNLADAISGARVNVGNQLATDQQAAANAGTAMRTAYFDNDFTRRNNAALLPIQLNASRLNFLDTADKAGQAGLNRSLNTLNWFATGATPPAATATTTTPSQVGTDIAGFGANLLKGGFSVGNAIGWDKLFGTGNKSTNPLGPD